jgi:hypothetical protein
LFYVRHRESPTVRQLRRVGRWRRK